MNIFERLSDETLENYILRLSDAKRNDKTITWQSIADNVSIYFGIVRSESWVRRVVKESLNLTGGEELLTSLEEAKQSLIDKTLELKKERVKLQDERIQNNAYVRKLAREDTIKEIALSVANDMNCKKFLPTYNALNKSANHDKEAILCISDWHYGLDFKNPWNEFSPEICKQRVAKLRDKTIEYLKENKISKLHLVNLQDLIAGRIHLGLRLESRYDVITQTLHVSEILAELITALTKYVYVDYYDSLDNHSRIEPNKNDAQDLETLCRIIPWYLKARLKDNQKISFKENTFGYDLITFETLGYKVIAAHGDRDPVKNIDHLSMMTEQHYDMLLTAHMHHFNCEEKNRCVALGNSSLMGVDSYAQKLRLSADPSQNLIIVSKDNPVECVYRILLK